MNQQLELVRVRARLDAVIATFIAHRLATAPRFHASELHDYVKGHGFTAPESATRVMRAMRTAGLIGVVLVSKSASLYEAVALEEVAA